MNIQLAAICVSIFLCALAIVWTCTSFCPCCCRRHPLVMVLFSGLITVLLAVSVALYVINHGKYVDNIVAEGKWMQGSKAGFIAQCVALALAVISKITSILHYKVHRQEQQ
ncbi:hypothetical protein AAVH_09531 [Aphelenchoides avenae]|nr:hypothetical protein AAVH_09531 [Aphelenchus avenae]